MKLAICLVTILMSQLVSAQTLREKRIKEKMLERVDVLISKASEARENLKAERKELPSIEKLGAACKNIHELFEIFPEHVKAIGGHLDLFDADTVWMKNQSLAQLIYVHQQSLVCKQGRDHEYIDISEVKSQLKAIVKSLEKQKKKISKASTEYENTFHYEYEF